MPQSPAPRLRSANRQRSGRRREAQGPEHHGGRCGLGHTGALILVDVERDRAGRMAVGIEQVEHRRALVGTQRAVDSDEESAARERPNAGDSCSGAPQAPRGLAGSWPVEQPSPGCAIARGLRSRQRSGRSHRGTHDDRKRSDKDKRGCKHGSEFARSAVAAEAGTAERGVSPASHRRTSGRTAREGSASPARARLAHRRRPPPFLAGSAR